LMTYSPEVNAWIALFRLLTNTPASQSLRQMRKSG
jgi:hypothetical protein